MHAMAVNGSLMPGESALSAISAELSGCSELEVLIGGALAGDDDRVPHGLAQLVLRGHRRRDPGERQPLDDEVPGRQQPDPAWRPALPASRAARYPPPDVAASPGRTPPRRLRWRRHGTSAGATPRAGPCSIGQCFRRSLPRSRNCAGDDELTRQAGGRVVMKQMTSPRLATASSSAAVTAMCGTNSVWLMPDAHAAEHDETEDEGGYLVVPRTIWLPGSRR